METQPTPNSQLDKFELTDRIRRTARELGFAEVGVSRADVPDLERFREWLSKGYAGQMHYLADRWDAYEDMNLVLDGVKSIVVLTLPYRTTEPARIEPGQGRVSRYAWGSRDYHDVIHKKLKTLRAHFHQWQPEARARGVVDSAPLQERQLAVQAGLGWIGKNTLLLTPREGSWFFLAAFLVDVELAYDPPFPTDHCGTCTTCLDACPTDAFPQPYVLDATRCISYLTIEHRGATPAEHRSDVGDWLFGCDLCQEVCPWNRMSSTSDMLEFQPSDEFRPADASEWFALDEAEWRRRFRKTPLWRAKRSGLLRNAAIVLGNQLAQLPREASAAESIRCTLIEALANDDPVIQEAVAWALEQDGSPLANEALARWRSHSTSNRER